MRGSEDSGGGADGRIEDAALAGIRVLDIGGTVATGYCGKLFADHGADVVDVEPPGGAITRMLPPFSPQAASPDNSALHAYLSANKRSVALDVAHPEGGARSSSWRVARTSCSMHRSATT